VREEHGKVEGDLLVTENLDLHGMVTRNVTVANGATLLLHGMICGDLVLEKGGNVDLFGTVGGDVTNHGGILRIYGVVSGDLYRLAGTTEIQPDAKVGGIS
jgi:hypothetical protein